MLLALVRKELLNNILNLRFTLVYALCLFLTVSGGVFLVVEYTTDKREYELNTNLYRRQALSADGFWPSLRDGKLVRPPSLMTVFAVGGEKAAETVVPSMKVEDLPVYRAELHRNPVALLFPSMDLLFVVGIVFSLLVFMLTYDAVAGEREEGTLRVLLSGPVPRDLVLLGKWIGGCASVLLPFVTGFVLVVIILYFSPGVTVRPSDWLRIAALLAVCTLYVATVFSVALTFSVLFRHSATVSLVLLMVWTVGMVAWPACTPYLAHVLRRPVTTPRIEFGFTRMVQYQGPDWYGRFDEARQKLFGGKRNDEMTEDERRQWYVTRERISHGIWRSWLDTSRAEAGRLTAAERAAAPLAQAFSRLSPYGCFQNACTRIAGTGVDREAHLRQAIAAHLRACWDHVIEGLEREGGSQDLVRTMPQIYYTEPSAAAALAGSGLDIGLLALMALLAFMLAYVRFMRMDIT